MRRLATLAMLLALGLCLQWAESALMLPSPLPGARLGLANIATLVVLARFGGPTAALFGILRHLVASLLLGGWFVPTFWLGMGGSLAVALLLAVAGERMTLRTAGLLSGALFQVGQSTALLALTGTGAMIALLPPYLALGTGAGWVTGYAAVLVERAGRPGWRHAPGREWLVAALLLVVALAAGFLLHQPAGEARVAHVYVAGQERLQIDLTRAGEYHLDLSGGHMLLQVEPGRIRVVESDCDDQVCVLSGWADRPGRPIYCAPYRTLITVTGGRSDVDGLLR